jgi:hypothetical protein
MPRLVIKVYDSPGKISKLFRNIGIAHVKDHIAIHAIPREKQFNDRISSGNVYVLLLARPQAAVSGSFRGNAFASPR